MRNDPNQDLQTLNQQDADFEAFYADILDEFGEETTSEEDFLKELMMEPSQEDVRPAADHHAYADRQKKEAPLKKDHSIRNLTILIFMELLGIVGVAAWWIIRLL